MNDHRSDRANESRAREGRIETKVPYEGTARRGFFTRVLTGTIAVLLGAIPAGLGIGFFLDPLIRRRRSSSESGGATSDREDADGFIRLDIGLAALPQDGSPISYTVLNDKTDAWNRFRNVEVGTVWLRRNGDESVLALSSICPHLGCAVDFRTANGDFFCPCHTSAFNLAGERTNHIPPRGMDRLETRLKPETGDAIWLKYQTFRATTPEKIPVT
jgi:menaquinol-cytochrome c reductase iron-sulfur subunit